MQTIIARIAIISSSLMLSLLLLSTEIYGQTAKGYWLTGGQLFFSSESNNDGGTTIDSKIIQANPMAGYFFLDNLAGGIKTSLRYTHLSSTEDYTSFSVGPFLRGYFLPIDRRVNIFAQSDYTYETQSRANLVSVNAGPVIYFHDNVGIEFSVGYSLTTYKHTNARYRSIQSGIGLQIHLGNNSGL